MGSDELFRSIPAMVQASGGSSASGMGSRIEPLRTGVGDRIIVLSVDGATSTGDVHAPVAMTAVTGRP